MSTTTLRAAATIATALLITGCDEPTRPIAPSEPRAAVGASSVGGGLLAYHQLTWQCGRDMMQGCDGDGPPGWNWVTRAHLATISTDGTDYLSLADFGENGTNPIPAWSPDGMQIAYQQHGEIFVVAGAGGTPRNLTGHAAFDGSPAWSPDGGRIAFVSDRGGARDLYVMSSAGGGGVTRLTTGVGGVGHPDWSPDAARITFDCVVEPGNTDVCRIDANGTGLVRLTSAPGYDAGADWSAAGRIAFATDRYGAATEIALMNADGSAVTRVAPGISGVEPDWSPDGGRLAFTRFADDYTSDVNLMGAEGANPVLLASLASSPAWRPTDAALPPVQSPVARIGAYTCLELTCSFDGSGSTDDIGTRSLWYQWSFGVGVSQNANSPTPKNTFPAVGTYTATFTVTAVATGKTSTTTQSVAVTVAPAPPPNAPPTANFAYSCVRTACTFDGRGSTDDKGIASYSWNLGSPSGGKPSGAVVTLDYKRAGSYAVTLTVRDAMGLSATITRTVTVAK